MKNVIPILLVLLVLILSCKKETHEPTAVNLISNSSFETAIHDTSFQSWTSTVFSPGPADQPMPPLELNAPPGGGNWSMFLVPLWLPEEGFAETNITGQNGNHVYQLSTWMKNFNWMGSMSLQQWRNGLKISEKQLIDSSFVWKQFAFYDTLSLLPTDTLCIHLSAGTSEVISGKVWFDLVNLKLVN